MDVCVGSIWITSFGLTSSKLVCYVKEVFTCSWQKKINFLISAKPWKKFIIYATKEEQTVMIRQLCEHIIQQLQKADGSIRQFKRKNGYMYTRCVVHVEQAKMVEPKIYKIAYSKELNDVCVWILCLYLHEANKTSDSNWEETERAVE